MLTEFDMPSVWVDIYTLFMKNFCFVSIKKQESDHSSG